MLDGKAHDGFCAIVNALWSIWSFEHSLPWVAESHWKDRVDPDVEASLDG